MDVNRLMAGAVQAHQAGRIDEARTAYDRILAADPSQPDALHYRGLLRQQTGDLDGAADDLAAAVTSRPRDLTFRFNLAEVLREAGRATDAIPHYRKVVEAAPGDGDARFGLANAVFDTGGFAEAVRHYQASARAIPDDPEILNNLGNAFMALGEIEPAHESYAGALALAPDYPDAAANLAEALEALDRRDEARSAWERADAMYRAALARDGADLQALIGLARVRVGCKDDLEAMGVLLRASELAPDDPQINAMLGRLYATIGRFHEARAHYRRAVAAQPENIQVTAEYAEAELDAGDPGKAEEVLVDILKADPDAVVAIEGLGNIALQAGRFDEAAEAFRRAIAMEPQRGQAWHGLGAAKRMTEAEYETLLEMVQTENVPPDDRVHMHFTLGDFADRQGDYDTAFAQFRAGNDIRRGPFDIAVWQRQAAETISTFNRAFFEARRGFGTGSDLPVFIIGMPRSGTTLTEQIAAGHPSVHGAGELYAMQDLVRAIRTEREVQDSGPGFFADLPEADARRFGDQHVALLEALGRDSGNRPGDAGSILRVVDKLPGNFMRLGIIALLMPRAKIVHTSRNAIDICVSCYFQNFKRLEFAFDLETIGAIYRLYREYMDHWRQELPLDILEIRYENLIADQESHSRRLIEHLGLPWDDACLAHHKTDRQIATASVWQARQPVYKTSVARWKRYEKHLGPLIEALGEYADE